MWDYARKRFSRWINRLCLGRTFKERRKYINNQKYVRGQTISPEQSMQRNEVENDKLTQVQEIKKGVLYTIIEEDEEQNSKSITK